MGKGNDLEQRTLEFSCALIDLIRAFPRDTVGDVAGRQLLRCGTSVGANYREANRAGTRREFIHKIGICEREASETDYWLEICQRKEVGDAVLIAPLLNEARELVAIFTSIGRNTKRE